MKTRLIVLTLVALLTLGMAASAAADGPPWGANVTFLKDPYACGTLWWDKDLNFIDISGTYQEVYRPLTRTWKISCNFFIDFDDPSVATIDEVCDFLETEFGFETCTPSTFILKDTLWCILWDGTITTDSTYIVNPSGQAKVTCHFNKPYQSE